MCTLSMNPKDEETGGVIGIKRTVLIARNLATPVLYTATSARNVLLVTFKPWSARTSC